MLRSRVIPCLLIHDKGLVKTIQFKNPKYIGDPINIVKIFNEKEVDELIVIDIDATVNNVEPDYSAISNLAAECRMPLCYGGGIKTAEQAQKIIKLGVEKVALSSAIINNPSLANKITKVIGKQSLIVVLDIKKNLLGGYDIYSHNGKNKIKKNIFTFIKELEELGIGELVINSISNDGVMNGYDISLFSRIRDIVDLPITFIGGAGNSEDILNLIERFKIIGAGVGSFFVFKGPYKAVLVSYLSDNDKQKVKELSLH